MNSRKILNALSVDTEEYFHPSEIQASVSQTQWLQLPSRIDLQIDGILELLDQKHVRATFFVLGWVAEHRPGVVRAIATAGHEIGCHSYAHKLIYNLTPEEFRQDTRRAIAVIEDACGVTPRIYRAPSYSITRESLWALEILVEQGFQWDSSIYPIVHDRYGIPGFSRHAAVVQTPAGPIHEIPIATVRLSNDRVMPIGGGAYLRLLPYRYTVAGIRSVNRDEKKPVCIYFHPWEIDADQPRLTRSVISRMRTYTGLTRMRRKLDRLLSDFPFSTITGVFGTQSSHAAAEASGRVAGSTV